MDPVRVKLLKLWFSLVHCVQPEALYRSSICCMVAPDHPMSRVSE